VRLPADALLPEATSLRGPLSCLNEARYGIVWGAVGAARACYEAALEYSKERIAFGKPIASFQLQQQKLAMMALEVNRACCSPSISGV
jgi:glutaryl-CoA dehydrogenase